MVIALPKTGKTNQQPWELLFFFILDTKSRLIEELEHRTDWDATALKEQQKARREMPTAELGDKIDGGRQTGQVRYGSMHQSSVSLPTLSASIPVASVWTNPRQMPDNPNLLEITINLLQPRGMWLACWPYPLRRLPH